MTHLDDPGLDDALRVHFGHHDFRPGQRGVIRSVLEGRPTLAVMPTGAGKSLCYQLPSLLIGGTTLVVSPLVALMKDQVDTLRRRGVRAAFINSSQGEAERAEAERRLAAGELTLAYVAPERFRNQAFRRVLANVKPALLAIDEAHCVSEWGFSFRPDYELLGGVIEELKPPRLLALTATATPDVRADIVRALRMERPSITVAGFDRPNIHLEVHEVASDAEKYDSVVSAVRALSPAIVYAATRRQTAAIVQHLARNGVSAGAYHAGLPTDDRARVQDAFLAGQLDVVAATNAFGLGVNKPDVRLVLHADLPRSLEAYYQEVGRAGRDGGPAVGALLFARKDIFLQRRLIDLSAPTPDAVVSIYEKLAGEKKALPRQALLDAVKSPSTRYSGVAALAFLESIDVLDRRFGPPRLKVALRAGENGRGEGPAGAIHRALGGRRGEIEEVELMRRTGCDSRAALHRMLGELDRAGVLKVAPAETTAFYALRPGAGLSDDHLRRVRVRVMRERRRLEQMIALASRRACRRAALLTALGEERVPRRCTGCDVCTEHRIPVVRSRIPAPPVARDGTLAS